MSAEPQLFRINPESRESERIEEVNFAQLGLQERRDIQEWIAANPGILGEDLLIIGKEFSGFDRTDERLDLLAVDADGKLVVIELKRDDTGADAHWQAIKYASYLHRAGAEDIIRMLADHEEVSESEALNKLLQHLGADDLDILNKDQRIILASHRFAAEVTSAALWLNEKALGEDLITCIKLTPYQDAKTDSLYIQANTIIPVPGVDEYVIGIGDSPNESGPVFRRRRSRAPWRNDDITRFFRDVAERVVSNLPDHTKPDGYSNFARKYYDRFRFYRLWYSRQPWGNDVIRYEVHLYPPKNDEPSNTWRAHLGFRYKESTIKGLVDSRIADICIYEEQTVESGWIYVSRRGNALDNSFADTLAETLRRFIEVITPRIDAIENERNEENA